MTIQKIKATIVGVTGYAGLELLRLLYSHPFIDVVNITNTQPDGHDISEQFPHFSGMYNLSPEAFDALHIMQKPTLFFLRHPVVSVRISRSPLFLPTFQ